MPSRVPLEIRRAWVGWLRFEYRALAVLLPIVCVEMTEASALLAHLPVYVGAVGALPVFLARGVWTLASEIG